MSLYPKAFINIQIESKPKLTNERANERMNEKKTATPPYTRIHTIPYENLLRMGKQISIMLSKQDIAKKKSAQFAVILERGNVCDVTLANGRAGGEAVMRDGGGRAIGRYGTNENNPHKRYEDRMEEIGGQPNRRAVGCCISYWAK